MTITHWKPTLGFGKASAAIKKRLLRRVFKSVVVSANGIELYYRTEPDNGSKGIDAEVKKTSELSSEALKVSVCTTKSGSHFPTFNGEVGCSPVVKIGDHGKN